MIVSRSRLVRNASGSSMFIRKMLSFLVGLVVMFIIIQFVKLATVGRLGSKISAVKNQQQKLELENELIKAEISKLHETSRFQTDFRASLELQYKDLNVITITRDSDENIFAIR
jgi:cell division protein FtsB